jgi:hypothetical protein
MLQSYLERKGRRIRQGDKEANEVKTSIPPLQGLRNPRTEEPAAKKARCARSNGKRWLYVHLDGFLIQKGNEDEDDDEDDGEDGGGGGDEGDCEEKDANEEGW